MLTKHERDDLEFRLKAVVEELLRHEPGGILFLTLENECPLIAGPVLALRELTEAPKQTTSIDRQP